MIDSDQVFSHVFKGLEAIEIEEVFKRIEIPDEWIKKLAEKTLSQEEMEKINSLGSFEKLMETLKKRLEEQKDRHQGGNKWIGTAGTSPLELTDIIQREYVLGNMKAGISVLLRSGIKGNLKTLIVI